MLAKSCKIVSTPRRPRNNNAQRGFRSKLTKGKKRSGIRAQARVGSAKCHVHGSCRVTSPMRDNVGRLTAASHSTCCIMRASSPAAASMHLSNPKLGSSLSRFSCSCSHYFSRLVHYSTLHHPSYNLSSFKMVCAMFLYCQVPPSTFLNWIP